MDTAMILVLILIAGVVALLAWFEINSRHNEAKMESKSIFAPSGLEGAKTKRKAEDESDTRRKKAA